MIQQLNFVLTKSMFVMVKDIVQKVKMKKIVPLKENVKRVLIVLSFALQHLMAKMHVVVIQVIN